MRGRWHAKQRVRVAVNRARSLPTAFRRARLQPRALISAQAGASALVARAPQGRHSWRLAQRAPASRPPRAARPKGACSKAPALWMP